MNMNIRRVLCISCIIMAPMHAFSLKKPKDSNKVFVQFAGKIVRLEKLAIPQEKFDPKSKQVFIVYPDNEHFYPHLLSMRHYVRKPQESSKKSRFFVPQRELPGFSMPDLMPPKLSEDLKQQTEMRKMVGDALTKALVLEQEKLEKQLQSSKKTESKHPVEKEPQISTKKKASRRTK
jgi:hypothetical protein